MGVGLGVAMSGEMLDAARDASIFQTLQVAGYHGCCHSRIATEGALTNHNIVGISIDIGHWGEIDVETITGKIGADGVSALVGIGRIAGFANRFHRLIFGQIEVGMVGQARHATALLVDTQQRTTIESTYLRDERRELVFIFDVPGIEYHATYGIVLNHTCHAIVNLLQFVGRKFFETAPVYRGVEGLGAHVEHLTYFFAKGHFSQLLLNATGRAATGVVIVSTSC